ncbi:MAG: hypothetical protein FJ225_08610 [Lentisphaerae bacterium]|nr:hypothetical protein [Lentisphaerota bacterium]
MSRDDAHGRPATAATDGRIKCDEIQAVLFDYMTRELGPARSELVREHLRKCPACQTAAAEIRATLDLLREASGDRAGVPARLSDERRRRLRWAFAHPVLNWIERHHVLVSLIATVLAVALALTLLRSARLRPAEPPETIPVIIGHPPGPAETNAAAPTP